MGRCRAVTWHAASGAEPCQYFWLAAPWRRSRSGATTNGARTKLIIGRSGICTCEGQNDPN
eukprot:2567258-Pyramimonas_sp.AAC.1